MKLSEAIRLGSMLHPQGFGRFAEEHPLTVCRDLVPLVETTVHTCAYGAALIAAGNSVENCISPRLMELAIPDEWEWFVERSFGCPDCLDVLPGEDLIFHLNDTHRWSRERIADWVEEQEKAAALTKAVASPAAQELEEVVAA